MGLRLAGLTVALALGATQATAQQAQPAKDCDVVVDSRAAGAIEMRPAPEEGSASSQIVWRPVASGSSVLLLVTYAGPTAHLNEPRGVFIEFRVKADLAPDSTTVSVKAANGRSWSFEGKSIAFGKDNRAQVTFGPEWTYGRGLISAIANNQSLTISVQQDGRAIAGESFALSNIDARDLLLAHAQAKFRADPAACR